MKHPGIGKESDEAEDEEEVQAPEEPMKKNLAGLREAAEKLGEDPAHRGPGDPLGLSPGDPQPLHAEAQPEDPQQEKEADEIPQGSVIGQRFQASAHSAGTRP